VGKSSTLMSSVVSRSREKGPAQPRPTKVVGSSQSSRTLRRQPMTATVKDGPAAPLAPVPKVALFFRSATSRQGRVEDAGPKPKQNRRAIPTNTAPEIPFFEVVADVPCGSHDWYEPNYILVAALGISLHTMVEFDHWRAAVFGDVPFAQASRTFHGCTGKTCWWEIFRL
jgi:hypothetical protein